MSGPPFSNVENARGNDDRSGETKMLNSIAAFFRGLFGRKEDNFKSLLIADLGIER